MDYERKYKEALERARVWKDKSGMPADKQGILDDIFPELKESEDEEVRKEIITFISTTPKQRNRHPKWINWLEKQGEQKPTWSEEDEERLSDAIFFVREYQIPTRDKRLLNAAKETEDWLKSLRPQNHWKPSDEQMEALDDFIYAKYPNIEKYGVAVKSLYQDLKRLREE